MGDPKAAFGIWASQDLRMDQMWGEGKRGRRAWLVTPRPLAGAPGEWGTRGGDGAWVSFTIRLRAQWRCYRWSGSPQAVPRGLKRSGSQTGGRGPGAGRSRLPSSTGERDGGLGCGEGGAEAMQLGKLQGCPGEMARPKADPAGFLFGLETQASQPA